MGLTHEEMKTALMYAYNGADFMFSASSGLKQMIINDHPNTTNINSALKACLLEGKSIALETDMIIRYCNSQLDQENTWLFDHGDIRVIPYKVEIKNKIQGE